MLAGQNCYRKGRTLFFTLILFTLFGCDTGRPTNNISNEIVITEFSSNVTRNYQRISDLSTSITSSVSQESNLRKYIPTENVFRNDINNKKIFIVLSFLGISVVGAIVLSFVNVHYDFLELQNFYRGYMGRRLLIQEGRLTHKNVSKNKEVPEPKNCNLSPENKSADKNGGVGYIKFDEILSPVTTTSLTTIEVNSYGVSYPRHMEDCIMSIPEETSLGAQEDSHMIKSKSARTETEDNRRALSARSASMCLRMGVPVTRRYIEDEGPEWRQLDYYVEVGTPPTSFCLFFQQYDWNIYSGESLTSKEVQERKNLLNQFRKWKKRKRKTFNIVVTERSRREMAEQEEEKNKKRIPPKA